MNSTRQVLVGGMPRSGTSLIRSQLTSHPDVAFLDFEVPFWTRLYDVYGRIGPWSQRGRAHMANEILNHWTLARASVLDMDCVHERLTSSVQTLTLVGAIRIVMEEVQQFNDADVSGLKLPRAEARSSAFLDAFPDGVFVHMVRDPRHVIASAEVANEKWWGGKFSRERFIAEWRDSARIALEQSRRNPSQHLIVRYEDLVSEPVAELSRVCAALGLTYDSSMLQMAGQPGWSGSNSSFGPDLSGAAPSRRTEWTSIENSRGFGSVAEEAAELGYVTSTHGGSGLTSAGWGVIQRVRVRALRTGTRWYRFLRRFALMRPFLGRRSQLEG